MSHLPKLPAFLLATLTVARKRRLAVTVVTQGTKATATPHPPARDGSNAHPALPSPHRQGEPPLKPQKLQQCKSGAGVLPPLV